jgi:hypothetical protein
MIYIAIFILAVLFAWYDAFEIEGIQRYNSNHPTRVPLKFSYTWRIWFRLLVLTCTVYAASTSWQEGVVDFFISVAIFWTFFDLSLNYMMGWQTLYVGNTVFLDRFVRKMNNKLNEALGLKYKAGEFLLFIKVITFLTFSLIKNIW